MMKSGDHKAKRRPWQPWELDMLRRFYPDERAEWVARAVRRNVRAVYAMAKKLGVEKSEAFRASPEAQRFRRGDNVGAAFRFKASHVPANKGVKGLPSRSPATTFKKGHVPLNHLPVGTVNADTAGYVKVKLREPNVWGYMAQLVWASTHDWPPPRGMVIRYLDGDRGNCHPDNLMLRDRRELMSENTVHNLPEPIKQLITVRRTLVRKINDHEQIDDVRSALFAQMDRLAAADNPAAEIERSKAMADLAQVVINSAKVEVDYIRATDGNVAPFLDAPAKPGSTVHRIK